MCYILESPGFICPSADCCLPARQLMQCMLLTPQRTAGWITNTMKSFEAATPVRRCMAVIANVARRYVIHTPIHRFSEIGPDCSFSIMRRLGPFRQGCSSPFGARRRARPRRQQARAIDRQISTRTRRPSRDIATRGRGRRRRLGTGISAFPTRRKSVLLMRRRPICINVKERKWRARRLVVDDIDESPDVFSSMRLIYMLSCFR